jgi:predicted secreted protein
MSNNKRYLGIVAALYTAVYYNKSYIVKRGSNKIKLRAKYINGNIEIKMLIINRMENKCDKCGNLKEFKIYKNDILIVDANITSNISKNPYFSFKVKGEKGDRIRIESYNIASPSEKVIVKGDKNSHEYDNSNAAAINKYNNYTNNKINKGVSVNVLIAHDIAENGAEVPFTVNVSEHIESTENRNITIYVENNPNPFVGSFNLINDALMYVSTRIKMADTSNVIAIASFNGKSIYFVKKVKVTIGGRVEGVKVTHGGSHEVIVS